MKNIYTLKYKDFDDVLVYLSDIYNIAESDVCMITDKYTAEYTMVDLLSYDDIEVDEVFLFESEFPMYVGLNKDGKMYVDDVEEFGYLDYNCVFIDMDCVDEYKDILKECIEKCVEKDLFIILFGESDDEDISIFDFDKDGIDEAFDKWIEENEEDEEDESEDQIGFESIDIKIEENDGKTTVYLDCSDGVDAEDILPIIEYFLK